MLPRLILVSLHKSGTHLALRLVEELGYRRRYFEDPLIRSARQDPPAVFIAKWEPNAAYFLHECRIDRFPPQFLDHWRATGDPLFIYQYRDPRAVLLSQVNYLRRSHQGREFSNIPYHLVFSDVLCAQPSERDALSIAVDCMGDYLTESFLGSVWMLHHPKVLSIRYERLAGPPAGGDAAEQREEISRVLRHLGLPGDVDRIASGLYDPTQRTFHRGRIDGWKEIYTPEILDRFEQRYGHLLDVYGYPREARA